MPPGAPSEPHRGGDLGERLRMFGKLFTVYPTVGDARALELKVSAYIEETRHVPALLISHALRRLVRSRKSVWAPSVYEILREAARIVRETRLRAAGKDPHEHNPRGDAEPEIDIARWLRDAPTALPLLTAGPRALQLGQGAAEPKATPEQRAHGAALLEKFVAEQTAARSLPPETTTTDDEEESIR